MAQVNELQAHVDDVASIFDEMAGEYDHLNDLWYRYTFGTIAEVLRQEFQPCHKANSRPIALDVGCGTGIQSLQLASMGYKVIGVDISKSLLHIAHGKLSEAGFHDAEFYDANASAMPLRGAVVDCVNCCGPTLSFVSDWRKALSEMARCLKPGGKLLLEVEGKWNFDLFWEIVSAVGFNFLGYDESLRAALSHLLPPWNTGHVINYSFKLESGDSVSMPLKLFSAEEIRRELHKAGFAVDKAWGLHAVTNLIPSTILHKSNPGSGLTLAFKLLSSIEKQLSSHWPTNSFACSLLFLAHKRAADENARR